MTNHLAAELRQILDDLHDAEHGAVPKPLVRERLERLAEHVERVATEPVAAEPIDLEAIMAGLDTSQEIRARALVAAARLLAPMLSNMSLTGAEVNRDNIARLWVGLADDGAAYIRTGERP